MTFKLDLTKFAEKAGDNADLVVRKVAFEIFKSVIFMTPVDTGRARANWNFAYGNIDYSVKAKGDTSDPEIKALGLISTKVNGRNIFISNNLPYAQRLEDGYSNQAPTGMVRVTVTQFQTFIKNAVRGL